MRTRALVGLTAVAFAAATATVTAGPAVTAMARSAAPAAASVAAADANGPNVSSTVLAGSYQTNNTVWAIAPVGGNVFVGGDFTSVRPNGDASGTGEVARSYIAEFSGSTGALLSFDPTLDGDVTAMAVSPDGSTLYIGGAFQNVNGIARAHLAAFNVSTGALSTTWKPSANAKVLSIADSPSGSELYIGGSFSTLDGVAESYVGAVNATGALQPWAPVVDNTVDALAVAPDDSRVLVGGYFNNFNGVAQHAIGSTDPTTGASDPFASTILPNNSSCTSNVKDIVVQGTSAYIASEGTGGGCFDGDFAVNISDGSLIWQNDCLGATQSLVIIKNWLFKGSHAHDCAYAPGGFPQTVNSQGTGNVTYHLLDQSLTDGSLGHFTPSTDGNQLGPRVMATDGSQLFLGGDFTDVNGKGQQGFAIFPAGVAPTPPSPPGTPVVTSTATGVDSVSFTGSSSPDVGSLTYSIFRDGGTKAIGTVTATSWPWALPEVQYRDSGLVPGSTHTYAVYASDGTHIGAKSAASAPVTVASANPALSYPATVLADSPSFFWRLGDTSGTTAADSSPNGFTGIYESGTTQGAAGPITGDSTTATTFNGSTGLVTSAQAVNNPTQFSMELWFKTTTNTGGKLMGFGNNQTGSSGNYDRHIYMMNDGQLVFGVYNNTEETIETPDVYNDGQWHYAVATEGPSGMTFYVDGQLIGTNSNVTPQAYTGYWRVGGDNLNGWNLDPWGSNSQGTTEPNSYYFQGTIGDVAVYPSVLSAAQVATHYAANVLGH
jgi:hypothetical protein